MNLFVNCYYRFKKIPATDKIFFLQNLHIMTRAGVPLDKALGAISEQTSNKKLAAAIFSMREKISQGKSFSEALQPFSRDFGELFINMVMAGEASGTLDQVIDKLFLSTKKDHLLNLRVRNALTYPAIILAAMILIAAFIVTVIFPTLTKVFASSDVALPPLTLLLIKLSEFIKYHGWLALLIIVICLLFIFQLLKTAPGKNIFDRLLLKTPILGPIIKQINLARISRSISSLISTDIPIVDNLLITSRLIANSVYRQALIETAEAVKQGQKIHQAWQERKYAFTPVAIQLMAIGEETGAMDNVTGDLADFYEEEVFQTMDNLPTIIEPILILIMGLGVAAIALAVILPIYALTQSY